MMSLDGMGTRGDARFGLTPSMADAARVIHEIAEAEGRPPSLRVLARELGVGVTQASNLRRALIDRGWLYPDLGELRCDPPPAPEACDIEITEAGRQALLDRLRRPV